MYMSVEKLGVAALSLARGGGSQFLERLLLLAADYMAADGAILIAHQNESCDLLCSVGLPLSSSFEIDSKQFKDIYNNRNAVWEDARRNKEVLDWAFVKSAPYWQSFRALKLGIRLQGVTVIAIFGSHCSVAPKAMCEPPPSFIRLIDVFHDVFLMITEIADLSNRNVISEGSCKVNEEKIPFIDKSKMEEINYNVVERFLIDTLISQPRILSRGSVSYHAIRRWRQTVKAEQIAALKAIKSMPSSRFEATIAEEMSSWCRRAFGATAFANVVAVPCGHSGDDCLSRRIGKQVAKQLGITFADSFERIMVSGSSHPKTNVLRPKMKLAVAPIGPILLVDDVATSGSHIEEATVLLRKSGLAVTSVTWIAAS